MRRLVVAVFLLAVVAASFWMRFTRLEAVPAALNRDEAALGYNALLLNQTGMDEWGERWPVTLQSFGDYKLIGYPAILAGLFTILPPNDNIVRLPAAVAGSLLPLLLYLLAREFKLTTLASLSLAYAAAFAFVFIFFSRMAFEAMVGLALFIGFLTLILNGSRKPALWKDALAVFLAGAAMLTYNTPFLLFPFVLVLVPFLRGIRSYNKWLPLTAAGVILWLVMTSVLSTAVQQKSGITIFSDETIEIAYPPYRQQFPGFTATLLGNKPVYYALIMSESFIDMFSPSFISFEGGGHPWHSLPGWGHLPLLWYILGVVGLIIILSKFFIDVKVRYKKRPLSAWLSTLQEPFTKHPRFIMLYLLLIATLPVIITVDAPHATRSLFFFAVWMIIGAYVMDAGFANVLPRRVFVPLILILSTISGARYLTTYFAEYPAHSARIYQAGLVPILADIEQNHPDAKVAVIDPAGFNYILFSWYAKLPPAEYFATTVRQNPSTIGLRYGQQAGKYHFIAERSDRSQEEALLVYWDRTSWKVE
jgi:hypothetical protein